MIIGLKSTKYIPNLKIDVSDDYEVSKTGQFRLELKTDIEGINDSSQLIKDYWEHIHEEVSKYFSTFVFNNTIYNKQYYLNKDRQFVKYLPLATSSDYVVTENERDSSPLVGIFNNALEFLDYKLLTKILIMVNIAKCYESVNLRIIGITKIDLYVPIELNDTINTKLLAYTNGIISNKQYIEDHKQYSIMSIDF